MHKHTLTTSLLYIHAGQDRLGVYKSKGNLRQCSNAYARKTCIPTPRIEFSGVNALPFFTCFFGNRGIRAYRANMTAVVDWSVPNNQNSFRK